MKIRIRIIFLFYISYIYFDFTLVYFNQTRLASFSSLSTLVWNASTILIKSVFICAFPVKILAKAVCSNDSVQTIRIFEEFRREWRHQNTFPSILQEFRCHLRPEKLKDIHKKNNYVPPAYREHIYQFFQSELCQRIPIRDPIFI